jgi:hypothetical protein
MMRVLAVLLALVATPFLAGVSQDHPGWAQRDLKAGVAFGRLGERGQGHDAEHCAMRAAQHPDKDINKCEVSAPPPPTARSILGTVFNDITGRPGLSGWVVELSGTVSQTAVTDAQGNYVFSNLPDGTYTICEVVQSGWRETYPPAGASCPSGVGYSFPLAGGSSASFVNFGNVTTTP